MINGVFWWYSGSINSSVTRFWGPTLTVRDPQIPNLPLETADVGIVAVAVDTVTFSDSADATTTRVAAATDTISLTDSADAITTRVAEAQDTVAFTDSAESQTTREAVAQDTVSFSDSADATVPILADATDSVSFADTAEAITTRVAEATDTVAFSDSADATVFAAIVVVADDTITFSDSAVAVKVSGTPDQVFGGGWVLLGPQKKKKKRKEVDEWAEDVIARRKALEDTIQELYAKVAPKVLPPTTVLDDADEVVVGPDVVALLNELKQDIRGTVKREKIKQSIVKAQAALDEEVARRARVRRNNLLLLLLE